ncbi:30S ribosomal protein S2 [Patescibacteria group bacterium]|nr:30S ribosomal protein S2 [Patescibacteria group bacterium]
MKEVTLQDLLKAGVHFGHQSSKWDPRMEPYIYAKREGIHIIDLQKTLDKLNEALEYAKKTVKDGGIILFVGTKKQAKDITKKQAEECGMPYIDERWLGGTFTNFSEVKKQIDKLNKLSEQEEKGELKKYTKKEQLQIHKNIERLEKKVGGLKKLKTIPEALLVVDTMGEKIAVEEAVKKHVPIIALMDTNANPDLVTYPVPANDDAIKAIELMLGTFSEAIKENYVPKKEPDPKHPEKGKKKFFPKKK